MNSEPKHINESESKEEYLEHFNADFEALLDEVNRISQLIKEAKTSLKKDFYKKKLEKVKSKAYKKLLNRAIADPSILKKQESSDEQVQ